MKKRKRGEAQQTKRQVEDRVRFALLLLDRMATPREVRDALMSPPRVDEATGKKGGGLGLTLGQAEYAYKIAVQSRADDFEAERATARSEQGGRLRVAISTCFREKKLATLAQFERLYGSLYGTFAPKKVRFEAGSEEADIARALAGMSAAERAKLAELGGDEEDEEP